MISYITVGADDIPRAKRFYSAFLPALGYELVEGPEGLSYEFPELPDEPAVLPAFYVKPPSVNFIRQRSLPTAGTKANLASAMGMALISTLATSGTLRETRLRFIPTIQMSPDATVRPPFCTSR
jgi:catechol 2,3-dioxygenase-like lactoylglutathione lyase family enzyme